MAFLPPDPNLGHIYEAQNETSVFSTETTPKAADPKPPAHFIGRAPSFPHHSGKDPGDKGDDIVLVVILPIVMLLLLGVSVRHWYVSNRRQALFHERRQIPWAEHVSQRRRALERAQAREERRAEERGRRRERLEEIEKALVSETASKCRCNASLLIKRRFSSMSDLTEHTTIMDEMSLSSSTHDIENFAVECSSDGNYEEAGDDMIEYQTCAICLECIGSGNRVSWSKFQTCRHAFHKKCIKGWLAELKNKEGLCPCCRGPYLKEVADEANAVDNEEIIDEEMDVDEERPDNTNVQITAEESNHDKTRDGTDEYLLTPDEESAVNAEAITMPEGNASVLMDRSQKALNQFTSFCIVHGLRSDETQADDFSIRAIEEPGALES